MLKPFWVITYKLSDRNTCACILCSNVKMLLDRVKKTNLINEALKHLIENSVCKANLRSKTCMFNKCQRCEGKLWENLKLPNENPDSGEITFCHWIKATKKFLIANYQNSAKHQQNMTQERIS